MFINIKNDQIYIITFATIFKTLSGIILDVFFRNDKGGFCEFLAT